MHARVGAVATRAKAISSVRSCKKLRRACDDTVSRGRNRSSEKNCCQISGAWQANLAARVLQQIVSRRSKGFAFALRGILLAFCQHKL
jgi:hypothetical protein